MPRDDGSRRLEDALSRGLTAGVMLAAAVMLSGVVLAAFRGGGNVTHLTTYTPGEEGVRSFTAIARGAAGLDPQSVMQFGVVLLILTPVARVALSMIVFARGGDRLYVALSLTVLLMLLAGFLGMTP